MQWLEITQPAACSAALNAMVPEFVSAFVPDVTLNVLGKPRLKEILTKVRGVIV